MRVVAMFRVSTEQQAQDGASLAAQERQYFELAERESWETVAVFRGCESATQASREREVLQQTLACIRRTGPDAIYVHEQSRLTRGDELEVAGLLRELRERQLKIVIGGVVRDLTSLDERFMIGIQGLVDRAEAERIQERQQRGKREKARQGLKNSGIAPYGYQNPPRGDPDRGRLRIVPEDAVIVQRIFALACEGLSPQAIATALNDEGAPSPRGGVWWKSSVVRILINPGYRGCHVTSGWSAEPGSRTFRFDPTRPDAIMVEDAHPAIVSEEVWAAAQAVKPAPRTAKPRMLTGMLTLNGERATGDSLRKEAYYRPPRGSRGGPWIPCETTDRAVWAAFVRAITEPSFMGHVLEEIRAQQRAVPFAKQRKQLQARLSKLENRLSRLTDMRADGELGRAEYLDRSSATRNQIRGVQQELEALQFKARQGDGELVRKMFAAAKALLASEWCLSSDEKRKVLVRTTREISLRARREPQPQRKDRAGRYQKVDRAPWRIESVTFDLAPPPSRDGCLDTSLSCSGPPGRARP